jgi:hypothetical protein
MTKQTNKFVMAGQAKRDPATQGTGSLGGRVKPGHDEVFVAWRTRKKVTAAVAITQAQQLPHPTKG